MPQTLVRACRELCISRWQDEFSQFVRTGVGLRALILIASYPLRVPTAGRNGTGAALMKHQFELSALKTKYQLIPGVTEAMASDLPG